MKMSKQAYLIAGAAVTALSVALVTDYVIRKRCKQAVSAGMLIAGLAGIAGGAVLAYQPEREMRKRLTVNDLIDDGDAALIEQNIVEVLEDRDE